MTKSDEASIVRSLRRIAKALESMRTYEERETTNGNEDAISREKAISMITGTASKVCKLDVIDSPKGLLMTGAAFRQNEIIDILQNLPSAQPEKQWIPCSERLPVEGESVLLCDRCGDMTLGRLVRTDEGYKWDIYAWWNDIDDWNAWMPLPEPYKGEQDE